LYDGQSFKKFSGKDQPKTRYIKALLEDDQNSTIDGLSRNHVRAITATDDGRIWLATVTGGIDIYDQSSIRRFSESDQLEEGLGINTISTDSSGRIWIGMVNEGVYCYDPNTLTGFWLRERTRRVDR